MNLMCYLVEAQVGRIVPKGLLSNGLTEFGVARPRIKSRVRLFFFSGRPVGMQVFHYRVDMILLDFFFLKVEK